MKRGHALTRWPVYGLALIVSACCALFSPTTAAGQTAAAIPRHVPRFHVVGEDFYRGGQPGQDGFEELKRKGVKTVINLREKNQEKTMVESLGMKSVHIPLNAWKKVPDDAIKDFFQILSDPANYPVFIHCRRGADRTGVMVGLYRIAFQGWEAEKAYTESRTIGMRWWYRGLRNQLFEFERQHRAENTGSFQKLVQPASGK
jgi:protein tyrosine phosphatase (PTP) superfamily phosphohydrolase (DUF442 family)